MDRATLILQDGSAYLGEAFGARTQAWGEIAFSTRVVGCVEQLTDPSCSGKLMLFTFPSMGGYGIVPGDFVSDTLHAGGVIVRSYCKHPSNYRSTGDLDGFLKERGTPGICGIDTRSLLIRLRRGGGAMNGAILQGEVSPDAALLERIAELRPGPFAVKSSYSIAPVSGGPRVAVVDLGRGVPLAKALADRGAQVFTLPLGGEWDDDALRCADAVALSDGPEQMLGQPLPPLPQGKTVYAEGVGHLMLALARGGKAGPMPAMHSGANLPVQWGDRVYITSQFHAWAVTEPPSQALEVMRNLNDKTVEGLIYPDALSCQFPLSTEKGPHDMGHLYDRFLSMAQAKE